MGKVRKISISLDEEADRIVREKLKEMVASTPGAKGVNYSAAIREIIKEWWKTRGG